MSQLIVQLTFGISDTFIGNVTVCSSHDHENVIIIIADHE